MATETKSRLCMQMMIQKGHLRIHRMNYKGHLCILKMIHKRCLCTERMILLPQAGINSTGNQCVLLSIYRINSDGTQGNLTILWQINEPKILFKKTLIKKLHILSMVHKYNLFFQYVALTFNLGILLMICRSHVYSTHKPNNKFRCYTYICLKFYLYNFWNFVAKC